MNVTTIIRRVRRLLQDTKNVQRWSDDDLLDCYNEAQVAIVQNRPDTYSQVRPFTCEAQAVQTLPADAYRLMDVVANRVSGRSVIKTTRDSLDALVPNWAGVSGEDVEQFIYDEKSPRVFYTYPVPPPDHAISILVSRTPQPVEISNFATDTTAVELDSVWLNPLVNYMMFRAYMIDAETKGNLRQAETYLKMFANDLQLKWNTDLIFRQPLQGDGQHGR